MIKADANVDKSVPASTIERLEMMDRLASLGGGKKRIEDQHAKGKKTARERISLLLDEGSFIELDRFAINPSTRTSGEDEANSEFGDGVVTGYGTIEGRTVFLFSHDFTIRGGSLGETFGKKVCKLMDLAMKAGAPIIGLNDSGGARIQEGVQSLASYSEIFFRNTQASGVVPQISVILGPCAGGAVYSPAMTDFVIMVDKISYMFITGPDVVKAALGEAVTFEQLGGPEIHSKESGVASFEATNEEEAFATVKKLLSFLPSHNAERPPRLEHQESEDESSTETLNSVIPQDSNKPYDMREVIDRIVDYEDFLEVHSLWAPNIVVGFGRLQGDTVGVVANQPMHLAGALDINSSNKAARFIRFCDAFNIPVLTLVDVPGYMPGSAQESGGIIKHGSKLLFAYCEATVPKITVITRKAYGGAYCAMGSKFSRADLNYAWPSAEIAVMGPEGAARIIYRKELDGEEGQEKLAELTAVYREKYANPFIAAERGIIDAVIKPRETRRIVISGFKTLREKSEMRPKKKHGNIQL